MEFNRVFLFGNLTRDPETRHTQSGAQVTNFTIAVNERRSGKDETLFIKVETWNKTAELVSQYLKKGAGVLVEGRLKVEEYDSRDGQKRRDPVIVAERVNFGPKSGGPGQGGSEGGSYAPRESSPARSSAPAQSAAPARRSAPASSGPDYGSTGAPADDYGDSGGGGGTEDDLPF